MTIATPSIPTNPDALRARARELLAIDSWPREQLVELQQERLRALLRHAVAHAPYYRETLGRDPAGEELTDLPTLSKRVLMDEFDRIVTNPTLRRADLERGRVPEAFRVFGTSGSTGVPGLFVYSQEEFEHWIAVGLAGLARAGVSPSTRLVAIGAPRDVHITRQLFSAFQDGREGVPRLSVTTPLRDVIESLNRFQPEVVIAYASVLGTLAQEQLAGALDIQPRLTVASSEVLTDETAARVRAVWRAEPLNVYAATEAPAIAAASLDRVGLHVFEHSVIVEVVDAAGRPVAPGEPGTKVLLTNLVNHAQPLIRYELSDSIVLAEGPDPSGRPFLRIASVDGRSDDILSFPAAAGAAVDVHPHRLRSPFATLLDVRQYQIVQERDGALRIDVVPSHRAEGLPDRVRAAVARALEEAGAAPVPVRVEVVAEIERDGGHAAKVKLVRSEVVRA